MRANEAAVGHYKIHSVDKNIRSTSVVEGPSSQSDSKNIMTELSDGMMGVRKSSPAKKFTSFTSLRHELSDIKNEVN